MPAADLLRARTDEGQLLPVLDLTHPALAVTATPAEIATLVERFAVEARAQPPMSAERLAMLRGSRLGRAVSGADGPFLSASATYLMKLGAEHLGPDASPIDRAIAGSFPALMLRLRTQDVAALLAEGLSGPAAAVTTDPLHLVNVGGGTAADSWNALLRLHTDGPGLLDARAVRITALDNDQAGPAFGGRAVEALRREGGPLAGVDVTVRCVPYDWSDATRLTPLLQDLRLSEAPCGISSEGALFEYGSDAEIVANLRALHAGTRSDAVVAGSVTRADGLGAILHASSPIKVVPRRLDAFEGLAGDAGWVLDRAIERPFSYAVRLRKA